MQTSIHKIKSIGEWQKVKKLYDRAFPDSERKPFSLIVRMWLRKKTDLWCVETNGVFAGFAATINSDRLILVDYFAVEEPFRAGGIGTAAMHAIFDAYRGKGVFVEIESIFEPCENLTERQRRRRFYLRCGMTSQRVLADVYGVPMELLGRGCALTFEDYRNFYIRQYLPVAAEHIFPLPFPESEPANSGEKD